MKKEYVFTSESVTRGHPDKLCDQISDAIVGRLLRRDRMARVIAECATSAGIVFVSMKHLSEANVDISTIARSVIRSVGYSHELFNPDACAVMTSVLGFPPSTPPQRDEAAVSTEDLELVTASDQATVFGFACRHTAELMPLPITLANKVVRELDRLRETGALPYLSPDGKAQIAVEFRDQRPVRINGISIVAAQLDAQTPSAQQLAEDLRQQLIEPVFADEEVKPDARTRIAINPDGPLIFGGPHAHAGLTGRKSGVDMYGEFARQSSPSLSGKDPSRIDRVGVYAARHAAKNVVAAGLADKCEVQLSYSIGMAAPVSVQIETFGTAKRSSEDIEERLWRAFDFRLGAIVRNYQLRDLANRFDDGFYIQLATYGQLGRPELELPWEALDRVDALLA